MSTPLEFEPVQIVPPGMESLACSCLRPKGWLQPALPQEEPSFETPTYFLPLLVTVAPYGAVLFSIAVRPAYGDGCVRDWMLYLCGEQGIQIEGLRDVRVSGSPALMADATQATDAGPMRLRLILLEDGERLYNVSVMAPEAIWPSLEPTLEQLLISFRLAHVSGPTAPLGPEPQAEP
jgi:hypothetical protein